MSVNVARFEKLVSPMRTCTASCLRLGVDRAQVLSSLKKSEVSSVSHYVPLHSSQGGMRYGRVHSTMRLTDTQSARLIRLPLWVGLTQAHHEQVLDALAQALA